MPEEEIDRIPDYPPVVNCRCGKQAIVVHAGSGEALCVECFLTELDEFERRSKKATIMTKRGIEHYYVLPGAASEGGEDGTG